MLGYLNSFPKIYLTFKTKGPLLVEINLKSVFYFKTKPIILGIQIIYGNQVKLVL